VIFQVAPNRLVGDEVSFECVDIGAVAFEAALNPGRFGTADFVVGQQPIRVF
jgi:hypothetical protein